MNRSMRFLGALALPLLLTGCEATDPQPETAQVGLLVDGLVGTAAYAPGTTYTVNGRATTFTDARIYVSNVRLVRADGSVYTINAETPLTITANDAAGNPVSHTVTETVAYLPLDLGRYEGTLGEVPAGTYTGIRFDVGLSGNTNRVDLTQAPAGHPLAQRTDYNNHWSWNSGYIFSRTEGRVDTDGDGTLDADWGAHIGMAPYVVPVEVTDSFTLTAGTQPNLHLQVDLAHLLENVDLSDPAQRLTHTMDNAAMAGAVRDAMPDAFHFHGLHTD